MYPTDTFDWNWNKYRKSDGRNLMPPPNQINQWDVNLNTNRHRSSGSEWKIYTPKLIKTNTSRLEITKRTERNSCNQRLNFPRDTDSLFECFCFSGYSIEVNLVEENSFVERLREIDFYLRSNNSSSCEWNVTLVAAHPKYMRVECIARLSSRKLPQRYITFTAVKRAYTCSPYIIQNVVK